MPSTDGNGGAAMQIEGIDLRLSIDQLPTTRDVVSAKLLHIIELSIYRSPSLRDTPEFYLKKWPYYFHELIKTHFKLTDTQVAEATTHADTLDVLVDYICDFRNVPPNDLFQNLPTPPARRHL